LAKRSRPKRSTPSLSSTDILSLFQARKEQPLSLQEMARSLEVEADRRRELRQILRELTEERKIIKLDRRHYSLPQRTKVIVGRVQAHREGYGFFIPENPELPDLFLNRKEMRPLMHQDRVALNLGKRERGRKRVPRVLEVLERAHRRVVGRFEAGKNFDLVIPDDPRLSRPIRIPKKAAGEAGENQIVLAEIRRYPTAGEGPEGRVLKVLGDPGDSRLDTAIVIHKYDLPEDFPPAVLEEAEAVPRKISPGVLAGRKDLRRLNFFTIDGETARDFDDAVAVSRRDGGHYKLWVSIADVSHYVAEKSPLDEEAFRRGTSVYFPERALPMLPSRLSNGICSLNPDEDRLSMTAAMEFDSRGRIRDVQLFPSVIRSHARLTYTLVREVLQEGNPQFAARRPEVLKDLQIMEELCLLLRARRMERGSIDFDLPEPQVILDVFGRIEEIVRAERNIAHQMIEEFMIAANEAVARFLFQEKAPSLNRVHEAPDAESVEAFREFVAELGYRFPPPAKIRPHSFQRLLDQVRGKPEEKSVNYLLLRSMKQARYSEKSPGHFALAADHYLHFTSPIRRYPDLVVHRIVKEVLRDRMTAKRRQRWQQHLPAIAEHASQRERVAMEAEREIVERKKVQFMRDKVGEEFNGYISGVRPFGLFVELEDFFIEGLIHLTRLPEDRYECLEKKQVLIGSRRGKCFRLGDRVRVRVDAAHLESRQIDFSLVQ
jgi:ribonuclease R